MLTRVEFDELIKPIEEFFDKQIKHYQRDGYFKAVDFYGVERIEKAVKHLIQNSRTFPTINELKNACGLFGTNNIVRTYCRDCDSTGIVSCLDVESKRLESFAFRCSCQNGQRLSKVIPEYINRSRNYEKRKYETGGTIQSN